MADSLSERNLARVPREPLIVGLQFRVERSRECNVARPAVVIVEVTLELEHVPEVVRSGEPETAIHIGRHGVVSHLPAERLGHPSSHLAAGEMAARDPDRLADEFLATLEDPERALADVLDPDARHLFVVEI